MESDAQAWGEQTPAELAILGLHPYPSDGETVAPTDTPDTGDAFGEQRTSLRKKVGGALAVLGGFLAKFKGVLLVLPKLKLLTTSGSMLVSIAAYSFIWGWRFAAGFVLLLLAHEMGHVIQLRREGVRASAPMFIPFMGAFIAMKELPKDALAEARVGLAGPVLGSLAAAAVVPIWLVTGNDFWAALAFTALFLNLINLMPALPLDGGRAMAAMAPRMWFVGFAVMIALTIWKPNPILILILLFGGMETWKRWKDRRRGEEADRAYYRVAPRHRLAVGLVYVGLIIALAVGMDLTHVTRTLADI
jgi:Zn-dependent protease